MTDPFRDDVFTRDIKLPAREFMYTLDQIALMLDLDESYLIKHYLYLPGGRSTGAVGRRLRCTNIARPDQAPNWRVAESDFKVWMQKLGVRFTTTRGARGKGGRR